MNTTASIEFTKQNGEVILTETYPTELQAQNAFEEISAIRWPMTFKGLRINASEWFPSVYDGTMRLIVTDNANGNRYERRELCRHL